MPEPITFPPGTPIRLSDIDLSIRDPEYDKPSAGKRIRKNAARMATLANIMYAENRHSILLVLQGMDTAGKDGTIRTVMQGVNPRSCQVVSFKRPTEEELDHDFLWRVHRNVPGRGNIGIFNRSHYEDVLAVRVHQLVPEPVWRLRYDHINDFEKLLCDAGTRLVKCFLMITKETQRARLQERIDDPEDRWKFNPGDLEERRRWEDYVAAYEEALTRCNTDYAPWYIIPSEKKWYRNLIVSELMRRTIESLDPKYPRQTEDYSGLVVE